LITYSLFTPLSFWCNWLPVTSPGAKITKCAKTRLKSVARRITIGHRTNPI
jgi:hypothetical protein